MRMKNFTTKVLFAAAMMATASATCAQEPASITVLDNITGEDGATYQPCVQAVSPNHRYVAGPAYNIETGAYGMFLGDYCKSLGKKAVHVGGALQLYFGIKGKRWDEDGFYNEHWIRPQKSDMPEGAELFECGTFAYW